MVARPRGVGDYSAMRRTAIVRPLVSLALLLALPFVLSPADFVLNARGLAWLTLLVVACTVLPFLLLARGIERAEIGRAHV